MEITLNIPDELARQVAPDGKDLRRVVAQLQSTSFHVSPEILDRLLAD